MSRIGKKIIELPADVTLSIKDSEIVVRGPKGELNMSVHPDIKVTMEGNIIKVTAVKDGKDSYPLWGLTRALIANMVLGVTKGFEKKLELVGVGYRAKQNGSGGVTLSLGYSNPIEFKAPAGIEIIVPDNTNITIQGPDKQLVGLIAANIRKLRKPEPYKGKGIKYAGEVVRRKAGKAGKAAGAGTGGAK